MCRSPRFNPYILASLHLRDQPKVYEFTGRICDCLERIEAKITVWDHDGFLSAMADFMGRVRIHLRDVRGSDVVVLQRK
jgi:hypothetical protein